MCQLRSVSFILNPLRCVSHCLLNELHDLLVCQWLVSLTVASLLGPLWVGTSCPEITALHWRSRRYVGDQGVTLENKALRWRSRRYVGDHGVTLEITALQWRSRRYVEDHGVTVEITALRWRTRRYSGDHGVTVEITALRWRTRHYSGEHSKDWGKLVKSILRRKKTEGISPEEIPHCVQMEQLLIQIKKR